MKLIRLCLILVLLGWNTIANAQEQVISQESKVLSLEQAIDLALKNNYDIRLAQNVAEVSANDWAYANLALAPMLNGTASRRWTNSASHQEFANGNKNDVSGIKNNTSSASVDLEWTLFDGLKMFATRQKVAAIRDLGEYQVKDQVVNTVANVIAGYYNIVQQKQQLKAITEQMSISEERVKLSDAKFQTGLGPKTDLLQAKVDLNAQKAARLRQLTLIAQSKSSLNQLLVVNQSNTFYDVTDTIPVNLQIDYATIRNNVLKANTALKVGEQNINIANLTVKERKGEFLPTINFNSSYTYNLNKSNQAVNQFSSIYNRNNGFNYGFTASIPIFNGLNAHRQYKAAKLDVEYQELAQENQKTQVLLLVDNAFKDYQYYKDAIELEEENILLAKENVMVALERFRQGVSTTIELKEAQQSLEDGYNRLITARYNTKLAETELLRLTNSLMNP